MDAFLVRLDKGKGKQRAVEDDGDANGHDNNLQPDVVAFDAAQCPPSTAPSQPWLASLNPAQREAVTWKPTGGLQILAGPGSGKTRVLTCRVAYLIKVCGINPADLIVVTFTNKAANEMKHRLNTLLGEVVTSKIMMGTFHSVAVKYLRKYGKIIELPNNFVIADQSDCQSILKPIVQQHNAVFTQRSSGNGGSSSEEIKVKVAQDIISKSKAKGISAEKYLHDAEQDEHQSLWKLAIGDIYIDYENALRSSNTLDFDDLLVFCERLLQKHPAAVKNIQHVLVDEFQDTNTIQYSLVRLMAKASRSLTIVGDPDQSIYAWRSAEVENLSFMLQDFKSTHQVFLEQNYRSTSSILAAALAVVQQDTDRIDKSLTTSHPMGPPVVLRKFCTANDEAAYIAYEIKRTIAQSGNQLTFNDFAILLRYNALSRAIESALQAASIPNRMVGGHKFFDRAEVKDVLAYLQLADNPSYTPAFVRTINIPKRGMGDKSVKDIVAAAKEKNISCFEVVSRALKGSPLGNIKPGQKANLKNFAKTILKVRQLSTNGAPVADLIDVIVESIDYKGHLERLYGLEYMNRLENINELKSFADQIARDNSLPDQLPPVSSGNGPPVIDIDAMDDVILDASLQNNEDESTPLRTFLASSMLSTDTQVQEDGKNEPKVTITTCHAAKGLEWPVVFLPAAELGVYPAFRKSERAEVAEERRLLYVAMTRAQVLLHMTWVDKRMERGQIEDKILTEFLKPVVAARTIPFSGESVAFDPTIRKCIATVVGRDLPDEALLPSIVNEFHALTPAPSYSQPDDHLHVREKFVTGAYSKPSFSSGGAAWRINAYAGDNAQRYAASLPNRGKSAYASAFATSQAPGWVSALPPARPQSQNHPQPAALSSFQSARTAFCSAPAQGVQKQAVAFGAGLHKPFKPPSMIRPASIDAAQVSTVETRLSQQSNAIMLQPAAPKHPPGGYALAPQKDDNFAFLKNLAKDEEGEDYIGPPLPVSGWAPGQKRPSPSLNGQGPKRSKA